MIINLTFYPLECNLYSLWYEKSGEEKLSMIRLMPYDMRNPERKSLS
jgi:hypothetical protein